MLLLKSLVRFFLFRFSGQYYRLLLQSPQFRNVVGRFRLFYHGRLKNGLKTVDSGDAFGTTVSHNLKNLANFSATRMGRLIDPISCIESLSRDAKILVIGPRNEADLLWLVGKGFRKENIRGLDLISYSDWIDLGDMHDMPYEDNQFDALLMGWTLTYSNNPPAACAEVLRLVRPGGIVAIGVEYVDLSTEETKQLLGYAIADEEFKVINSTGQILALFGEHVEHVYFNHDAPLKRSHTADKKIHDPSSTVVIFSISK